MLIARPGRSVAAPFLAVVAALAMVGCGSDGPDKEALVGKLKSSDTFEGVTDPQASCIADVVIKRVDAGDVQKYVDGEISDLPEPENESQVEAEVMKCRDAK